MKKSVIIIVTVLLALIISFGIADARKKNNYNDERKTSNSAQESSKDNSDRNDLIEYFSEVIEDPDTDVEDVREYARSYIKDNDIIVTDKNGNNITDEIVDIIEKTYEEGGYEEVEKYIKENGIKINGMSPLQFALREDFPISELFLK